MSESSGSWTTCPDCGNKFFALETEGGTECEDCGATL